MNKIRANSSPELLPSARREVSNDSSLEGAKANAKLLLELINDHTHATKEDDARKPQRVTGMMTILDDIKSRLENSQFRSKREPELRRCNSELRCGFPPKERRKPQDQTTEENYKLRRELNSSMMARKNIESMFSSLGKEKAIMTAELARKAQELSEMEELVDDLKAQNDTLSDKVKTCAAEHKAKKNGISAGGDPQGSAVLLQERNKLLSEQLLKSLDGYRSMKRKLKEAQGENARIASKMEAAAAEVAAGIEIIHGLSERIGNEGREEVVEELAALERVLVGLQGKLPAKGSPTKGERLKPVADMPAEKPSGLVGADGEQRG